MEEAADRDDFLEGPATEAMRAFFGDLSKVFPSAAKSGTDTRTVAAYEFQSNFMQIHFPWEASDEAAQMSLELAQNHGLGLYDLKSVVIFPDEDPHARPDSPPQPSLLNKVRQFFGL